MSDTCEYEDQGQEPDESDEIPDFEDIEVEERVQDGVEEMLETEGRRSSLVEQPETQRKHSWAYVGKVFGVIMLGVLAYLGCAWVGSLLTAWIGGLYEFLLETIGIWLGKPSLRFGNVADSAAVLCGLQFGRVVANLTLGQ